ncbi:MAG: hypothetical protein QXJ06_00895 [Candidatus Aenigmatarchaeota archaeon]
MIKKLHFLQYFKDKKGFIYYASGFGNPSNGLRSVLVYIPFKRGERKLDGIFYTKKIINGVFPTKIDDLPFSTQKYIKSRLKMHPVSKEFIISVPKTKISNFYNPKKALKKCLSDQEIEDKLEKVIELLEKLDIPFSNLGVYGGLQVGILNKQKPRKDIDILVYGLDFLKNLKNPKLFDGWKRISKKRGFTYPERALKKRDKILSFEKDDIKVDIKFVPLNKEALPELNYSQIGGEKILRGVVIDDKYACTLPSMFILLDRNNRKVVIRNHLYPYIGAAWKGDIIEVKGREVDGLIVVDSFEHYIIALK